jgi:hypothetical protein|tara:strand:+ start:104 stop:481 length:378 start_codon:yes stop_codon:yes gene_type:complete
VITNRAGVDLLDTPFWIDSQGMVVGRPAGNVRISSVDRHQSNMLGPPEGISIAWNIRDAVAVPAKGARIKNHPTGAGTFCLVDNIANIIRIPWVAYPIENDVGYSQLSLKRLVPGFKKYIQSQAH